MKEDNKKIVWRLKEPPTPETLRGLVKDGILTKDEAREVLFVLEEQADRDAESLKSEIKFLRELVEKLAQNRGKVVAIIKEIDSPYWRRYPWWEPYWTWSNSTTYGGSDSLNSGLAYNSFSNIKTF